MKPTGRPPIHESRMNDWIHIRVTREQAEFVRQHGGYAWLRELISAQQPPPPARLEDVWKRA